MQLLQECKPAWLFSSLVFQLCSWTFWNRVWRTEQLIYQNICMPMIESPIHKPYSSLTFLNYSRWRRFFSQLFSSSLIRKDFQLDRARRSAVAPNYCSPHRTWALVCDSTHADNLASSPSLRWWKDLQFEVYYIRRSQSRNCRKPFPTHWELSSSSFWVQFPQICEKSLPLFQ